MCAFVSAVTKSRHSRTLYLCIPYNSRSLDSSRSDSGCARTWPPSRRPDLSRSVVGGGGAGAGCCHSATTPWRFAPGTRGCTHALTRVCSFADRRRGRLECLAVALRPLSVAHRPRRRVVWFVATFVAPDAREARRGSCCLPPGGGSDRLGRRRTPAVTRWRAERAGGWRGWRYVSRSSPLFFSFAPFVCAAVLCPWAPRHSLCACCAVWGSQHPSVRVTEVVDGLYVGISRAYRVVFARLVCCVLGLGPFPR